MKTNLIFTSIVLLVLSLKSQSESLEGLFADPDLTWGIEIGYDVSGSETPFAMRYTKKDTECGGELHFTGLPNNFPKIKVQLQDKKMFSTIFQGCEKLEEVFDFGLEVGDLYTINRLEYEVISIKDSTFADDKSRRIFTMYNAKKDKYQTAIEGIGLEVTGFNSFGVPNGWTTKSLVCVLKDSLVIFLANGRTREECLEKFCPKKLLSGTSQLTTSADILKFYPNPGSSHIRSNVHVDELFIYNLHGNLIMKLHDIHAEERIEIGQLDNGIYTLRSLLNNKIQLQKFLKIW